MAAQAERSKDIKQLIEAELEWGQKQEEKLRALQEKATSATSKTGEKDFARRTEGANNLREVENQKTTITALKKQVDMQNKHQ